MNAATVNKTPFMLIICPLSLVRFPRTSHVIDKSYVEKANDVRHLSGCRNWPVASACQRVLGMMLDAIILHASPSTCVVDDVYRSPRLGI